MQKIQEAGFRISSTHTDDFVLFRSTDKEGVFQYDGFTWDYLTVSFADNMFLQIGFRKKFSNKEDALVFYDKIDILTLDKYQFKEAYTDSVVYKHKMAYGRNNVCNSISTFKVQVNDSTITYETSDVYSDRRLKR